MSAPTQDQVLQEDIEILWRLTCKNVAASPENEKHCRTFALKHLNAMTARHGEAVTVRAMNQVFAELKERLAGE